MLYNFAYLCYDSAGFTRLGSKKFRKGKTTMKKTLAIVLALAMVLCMIPAAFAAPTTTTTQEISGKQYTITVSSVSPKASLKTVEKANSISADYKYESLDEVATGKFSDKKRMALVEVAGFADFDADAEVTIDGKKLDIHDSAYDADCLYQGGTKVVFPVELTKAGYTDSFVITIKGKAPQVSGTDKVDTIETAKISVTLKNISDYKTGKTATVTNIKSSDTKAMDAYIVGSKIYFDWAYDAKKYNDWAKETVTVTFADENGAAFKEITWAYDAIDGAQYMIPVGATSQQLAGKKRMGAKLDKSALKYNVHTGIDGKKFKFELETASAIYETKEYTAVVRSNVAAVDPKGIYFAESTKTIKRGESYVPVVMGVATGKAVTPDKICYGTNTSKEVIEIEDDKKVIGTKEGVAYITAEYQPYKGTNYTASSMKIIVTEGEVAPAEGSTTTYYVTCRTLNVRKGAGTSYAKAGKLHRGDKVEVVSISKNWAKLANGTYVSAKYIAK